MRVLPALPGEQMRVWLSHWLILLSSVWGSITWISRPLSLFPYCKRWIWLTVCSWESGVLYQFKPIMAVVIVYTCISKAPSLHIECLAFHIYSKLNNPVRSSAQPGSKEEASEMVTPCYRRRGENWVSFIYNQAVPSNGQIVLRILWLQIVQLMTQST